MDFINSVAASIVAAALIYLVRRSPKASLRRPSIWSPWGRFLLGLECWLRHPVSKEKRAELQYCQGWNSGDFEDDVAILRRGTSAGDAYGGGYGAGRA